MKIIIDEDEGGRKVRIVGNTDRADIVALSAEQAERIVKDIVKEEVLKND